VGEERWNHHPPIVDDLKDKAKKLGLWNMFLPKGHYKESPGFTNLEYGLMAEWLGKSRVASEAVNCSAPDTGNMEVLAKYGNEEQKARWLKPLMDGDIRSAFLMTEPQVASSDARNIEMNIRRDGDYYVLNGQVGLPPRKHPQRRQLTRRRRNGGRAVQETQDAKSTLSWARATLGTKIRTDNSRSFSCRQTPEASPSTAC
jgi:hypothetical protein